MEERFEIYKDDRTGLSTMSRWTTWNRIPYKEQKPDVKLSFEPQPYAAPHSAFSVDFGTSMDTSKPRTGSVSLTTEDMRNIAKFLNEQADIIDEKAKEK